MSILMCVISLADEWHGLGSCHWAHTGRHAVPRGDGRGWKTQPSVGRLKAGHTPTTRRNIFREAADERNHMFFFWQDQSWNNRKLEQKQCDVKNDICVVASVSKPLADAVLYAFRLQTNDWCSVVKNISFLIWSDIDLHVVTGNRLTEVFHSFCGNKFVLQTLVWNLFCLLFYNVCQLFAILYSGLNKMWQKNYSPLLYLD